MVTFSRTKPASRSHRTRSRSSSSSRGHGSRSPAPKLYPVGDGTYAPLDFILALRRKRDPTVSTERQSTLAPSTHVTPDHSEISNRPPSSVQDMSTHDAVRLPAISMSTADPSPSLDFPTSTLRAITDTRSSYDLDPFLSRFGSSSSAPLELNINQEHGNDGGYASTSLDGTLQLPAIRASSSSEDMSYFSNSTPAYHRDNHNLVGRPRLLGVTGLAEHDGDLADDQSGLDGLIGMTPNSTTMMKERPQGGTGIDAGNKARGRDDYLIHSEEHRKKFLGASSSQVSRLIRYGYDDLRDTQAA
jgi:hypothetical protein